LGIYHASRNVHETGGAPTQVTAEEKAAGFVVGELPNPDKKGRYTHVPAVYRPHAPTKSLAIKVTPYDDDGARLLESGSTYIILNADGSERAEPA
jgi:hypothetical protein